MRQKLLSIVFIISMMAAALTGCGGSTEKEEPKAEKQKTSVNSDEQKEILYSKNADEYLKEYIKGDEATKEDAKAFLEENLKYLDFTDDLQAIRWPKGLLEAQEAIKNKDGDRPFDDTYKADLFKEFSESEYPTERFFAYGCMKNLSSEERLSFYKKRFKVEDDPAVLIKMLWYVRDRRDDATDKEILDFYTAMSEHENPLVRAASANISYLTCFSTDANTLEITTNTLVKLLGDENIVVKDLAAAFCDMAPKDTRIIESLKAILANDADAGAHGNAAEALQFMWTDYPSYKETSSDAYYAFVEYLKKEPRSAEVPSWIGIAPLSGITKDKLDAFTATMDFYNATELGDIYTVIMQDTNTDNLTRTSAVKGLAFYGTYDQFVAAKAYIDGIEDVVLKSSLTNTYDDCYGKLQ